MPISPKISRQPLSRTGAGAVGLATALLCVAALTACGSKSKSSSSGATTNVNTAQVASSIHASILAQRHLASTVVCPPVVAAQAGKTFECVATTTTTKKPIHQVKTPFLVTIQNNRGGVTYVGK